MRVALLLPANISYCPYANIYMRVLDELDISYDIIYCDKNAANEPAAYRYDKPLDSQSGMLAKFLYYWKFSRYISKVVKSEGYNKLIVFTPQLAIFLYPFLKKYYAGRFILDYRDLSIEQKFMGIYKKVQKMAAYNMISSPGFKKYLPKNVEYILSHNFNIDILKKAIQDFRKETYSIKSENGPINVLTIGGIRDYEQNKAVMMALGNQQGFRVSFVGRGNAAPLLEKDAKDKRLENVTFKGFYKKEDEPCYIKESTLINIFYPRKPSHDTAISNRFYNSLIFRKPMITTKNTVQGDYSEKFNVGIAIESTQELPEQLAGYIAKFDSRVYEENRMKLLEEFYNDYQLFYDAVSSFVGK